MNAFRLQADLIDGAVILVARAMVLAVRCRRAGARSTSRDRLSGGCGTEAR